MTDVVREGQRKIEAWLGAQKRLADADREQNAARCDLANSATDLARWLLPEDAKEGEKIAVWFGDTLIQAECTSITPLDGKITVRKRGKGLWRAEARASAA